MKKEKIKKAEILADPQKVNKIIRDITNKFPVFKGIEPKISERIVAPQANIYRKLSLGTPGPVRRYFTLRWERKVRITRTVRITDILIVTFNDKGEIIKISQSR